MHRPAADHVNVPHASQKDLALIPTFEANYFRDPEPLWCQSRLRDRSCLFGPAATKKVMLHRGLYVAGIPATSQSGPQGVSSSTFVAWKVCDPMKSARTHF